MTQNLHTKHCSSYDGAGQALNVEELNAFSLQINKQWHISTDQRKIKRELSFKDFYHTMAFVNALAWMANTENHHPDLEIGYNYCYITFSTHSVDGLTENDFICAAKVDQLIDA